MTLPLIAVFLILVLILLGLAGLFSALESGSLTVNRQVLSDMEAAGDARASAALKMLANTRGILAGSLTGSLFSLLVAGGLLKLVLDTLLPHVLREEMLPSGLWWVCGSTFWTLVLLPPLFLLFGELVPRQWCRMRPDTFVRLSTGSTRWLLLGWMPIADAIVQGIARMLRLVGLQSGLEPVRLTREDLRELVDDPSEVESPSPPGTQRGMIRSILSLGGTLVREVMHPIGEVVAIRLGEMTPTQVVEFARRYRLTRYPVYRERMIDLIGYINIYDLLAEELEDKRLEDFIHEPLYMPETARVDALLQEFLRQKIQCAIVFDEHGTCSGWVTREDVLEQIVGDLDVEGDPALLLIQKEGEGIYRIDPRMDIDDLNRLLDVTLDKLHCETVGGYVYSVLGRVPLPGERIYLRRWILEVVEAESHIIRSLRLLRRPDRISRTESIGG